MARRDNTSDLHDQLAEAVRTGDHAAAAEARRALEQASGKSWKQHYNDRWAAQQAIPDDELI